MKLRTTCDGGHVSGFSHDHEHDAAAAHALVIALQEQMMIGHRLSVAPIELRATNLLREWGYAE